MDRSVTVLCTCTWHQQEESAGAEKESASESNSDEESSSEDESTVSDSCVTIALLEIHLFMLFLLIGVCVDIRRAVNELSGFVVTISTLLN